MPKIAWLVIVFGLIGGGYGVSRILQSTEPPPSGTQIVIEDRAVAYTAREQWILRLDSRCPETATLVFERLTLLPENLLPDRDSAWQAKHIMVSQLVIGKPLETVRLADADLSSRDAIGLAGIDESRIWIETWALNWLDGTVYAQTDDSTLEGTITWTSQPTDLTQPYERQGQIEGLLSNGNQRIKLDCPLVMIYQVAP